MAGTTAAGVASGIDRLARMVGASASLVANVLDNVERIVADATVDALAVARESEQLYGLVSVHAATAREAVRAAPRFARIVGEVVRIAAGYRLAEARAPFLAADAAARERDDLHRRSAERLYALCVELRGAVLKLGQFASSRPDLLPAAYVEQLALLQDRVPAVDCEAVVRRIADELGHHPAELFGSFELEPIAAASLAQVHGAVLCDGTEVVVKVQVPGIEDVVEVDLAALRLLATSLSDVFPQIDLETIAEELCRSVRCELDYEAEAAHATRIGDDLAGEAGLVVPEVHGAWSSRRVLTLARIRGSRITEFLDGCEKRGEAGALDRDRVFELLIRGLCAQILEHGFFHADPHPGNFLVVDGPGGPELAILDFGSVGVLSREERRAYADLVGRVLLGDAQRVVELLRQLGFETRGGDPMALHRFAELFLDAFRSTSTFDLSAFDPAAQIEEFLRLARENPVVRVPSSVVLLGRVFATLGGLLARYRPRVSLVQILLPHLARAAAQPVGATPA